MLVRLGQGLVFTSFFACIARVEFHGHVFSLFLVLMVRVYSLSIGYTPLKELADSFPVASAVLQEPNDIIH
jgi:hypothetical protein